MEPKNNKLKYLHCKASFCPMLTEVLNLDHPEFTIPYEVTQEGNISEVDNAHDEKKPKPTCNEARPVCDYLLHNLNLIKAAHRAYMMESQLKKKQD